jgi:hypothetical protein
MQRAIALSTTAVERNYPLRFTGQNIVLDSLSDLLVPIRFVLPYLAKSR